MIRRLVEFLQQSDFAGVILTKEPMEGTFTLAQSKIDSADAPDVVMSFRWNDSKNQFGVRGMIDADWQRRAGKGTHATLSRFDMHNTLVVAGPDFRRSETDDLLTGNVDLTPTILAVLGMTSAQKLDGARFGGSDEHGRAGARERQRDIESGARIFYRQMGTNAAASHVGPTVYLDEGNGEFVPAVSLTGHH